MDYQFDILLTASSAFLPWRLCLTLQGNGCIFDAIKRDLSVGRDAAHFVPLMSGLNRLPADGTLLGVSVFVYDLAGTLLMREDYGS